MRIEPTAEDLAVAMRLHSLGVLENYQRTDDNDAYLMLDAMRERKRQWTKGAPIATCASWRLAHQGFTDPLNPGMDCIHASEL